jgi:hypothetical protein
MTPLRPASGPLNVERLREPFRGVTPMRLNDEARTQAGGTLVLPSGGTNEQLVMARFDMLREALKCFPSRLASVRECIKREVEAGGNPVDAVYVGIMSGIDDAMHDAFFHNPDFTDARRRFDLLHVGMPYAMGAASSTDELRAFCNHGLAVMVGLMEAAPKVYEKETGERADLPKLRAITPSASEPMMSSLARITGGYATYIEQRIGIQVRRIPNNMPRRAGYGRWLVDTANLEMTAVDGVPTMDVRAGLADDILRTVRGNIRTGYHGCLAGLVRMEEGGPNAFAAFSALASDELRKHWVPHAAQR